MVVFSHSFALSGQTEPLLGGASFGTIGVWVFFILSGYLIAASWDQYPRFNVFFAKRALRVFPGLMVNLVIALVVLGIFFSSYAAVEFFRQPNILQYLNNVFLYDRLDTLPGVFSSNPHVSINSSLWTLPYEFTMYIMVALIGVFGVYKKVSPVSIWIGLFIFELIILTLGPVNFDGIIFYLRFDRIIMLGLLFFSGIVMYKHSNDIKLSYRLGAASLLGYIVLSLLFPQYTALFAAVLLAYALFALGRSSLFSSVSKIGDLSYGIYIYSFPVQQSIYVLTETNSPLKMFIASYGITFVMALLSWHLVESRALKLKKRIKTNRYPLAQADNAW